MGKQGNGPCEVYGIRDGARGKFHYVGISRCASQRFEKHKQAARVNFGNGGKVVRALGERAQLFILSRRETRAQAVICERKWSHRLARWGHPLKNVEVFHRRQDLAALKEIVRIQLTRKCWLGIRLEAINKGVKPGALIDEILTEFLSKEGKTRRASGAEV